MIRQQAFNAERHIIETPRGIEARPHHKAQVLRRDPQEMGLLPDGNGNGPLDAGMESEEQGVLLGSAARTMQFWTMCVAQFSIFFCLLTMIVHIVPHGSDLGLPAGTAAGVLAAADQRVLDVTPRQRAGDQVAEEQDDPEHQHQEDR